MNVHSLPSRSSGGEAGGRDGHTLRARTVRLAAVFPAHVAARLAIAGYDVTGYAPVLVTEWTVTPL